MDGDDDEVMEDATGEMEDDSGVNIYGRDAKRMAGVGDDENQDVNRAYRMAMAWMNNPTNKLVSEHGLLFLSDEERKTTHEVNPGSGIYIYGVHTRQAISIIMQVTKYGLINDDNSEKHRALMKKYPDPVFRHRLKAWPRVPKTSEIMQWTMETFGRHGTNGDHVIHADEMEDEEEEPACACVIL